MNLYDSAPTKQLKQPDCSLQTSFCGTVRHVKHTVDDLNDK